MKSDEFFLLVFCTRSWHNSPQNICILTDEDDEDDDYLLHLTPFTGPKGVAFQQ